LFVATPGAIDQAGLILNKQSFMLNENTQANIQVMMSVQPVYEIKEATLRLIPYSFLISIFISFAAAFYFSKKMSQPIRDLLEITEKMAAFEKDVFFESEGQDEVVALGYNINNMYLKLQTAIYELEDNIKEMYKIEREKEHFFKSASHELKTPLTSLSVLLENMQLNIGVYQDRDYYLKEALQLVTNANDKISQILAASDFQSISVQKREFDLKQYISLSLKGYQHIIMKKKLLLKTDLLAASLYTDELYFKVVIDNLLSNAFFYTPTYGEVSVDLSSQNLIIKNELAEGVHIDESLLFEPFYREDTSSSSISRGTGLGLYLVKKNLELLKLDFEVEITEKSFIFKIYF
ncbi:MAG TPA: HAMP domain-containing sensor histidine kinase, partial [Erysipelothrix sp.]